MSKTPSQWDVLAELVTALGTERFSGLLHRYLESGVSASVLFAYAIGSDAQDADLLLGGARERDEQEEHSELLRQYGESGFSKDPLIRAERQSPSTAPVVQVRHASEMTDPEFRYLYFDKMGVTEEISIVGGQGSAELLYIGFSGSHFSEQETRFAQEQAPLVLALLQKDRALRVQPGEPSAGSQGRESAIVAALTSHPAGLTRREVEVCTQIMRGLSAEAVALELNISKHTVITHRKRAYAKLRISSQGELFAKVYRVASIRGTVTTSPDASPKSSGNKARR